MIDKNIRYKQLARCQFFGDDNIFNTAQYQYNTSGSTVNNSIKMRFNLKGALSDVILSRNARAIVEMACIPSITNMAGNTAIVSLISSTQDKVFDTKNFLAGNPILFCMATSATVNTLNTLYNATEFFYNINIPSNFLSNGYIDVELEVPAQKTTAIDFITGSPLNNFYINLVIVDEDLEQTFDTVLAPPVDFKNYNTGKLSIKMY